MSCVGKLSIQAILSPFEHLEIKVGRPQKKIKSFKRALMRLFLVDQLRCASVTCVVNRNFMIIVKKGGINWMVKYFVDLQFFVIK